ncbi:MAG: S8 family peptidase [Bacteroidota bacterium]
MRNNYQWFDRHHKKLSKRLRTQLLEKPEDEPLPIIIMLHDRHDVEVKQQVQRLGGEITRELPLLGGFAAVLPGKALAEICPGEKIKQVHLDRKAHPCLHIGVPTILADRAQASGFTGRGATIAFLDSGIHPHADFMRPAPRIVAWHDVVNHRSEPYDDHGHGTHVAGIAAGNGYASRGKYRGVAPEANIAAVKVADEEGTAPMSYVVEGLQWVLDNKDKHNIRIVNLSLGSDPSESYRNDPLCQAVEQVWRAGLVVVVAAGNDGPERGSIDTPGNDPLVITVGAMDDERTALREDDLMPDFSSRGPTNDGLRKPDLLAPGVDIWAPKNSAGYARRTGTSMATPFVSGAAAVLLAREPELTPDQVKRRLKASAENRNLPVTAQGAGYLNMSSLLKLPSPKQMPAPVRLPVKGRVRPDPYTQAQAELRSLFKGKLFSLAGRMLRFPLLLIVVGILL